MATRRRWGGLVRLAGLGRLGKRHISRRVSVALLGAVLAAAGSGAWAQAGAASESAEEVVTGVDEMHGRSAHRLVESWVRRGGVPGQRAEALRARGVLGVRVTLRLRGVTVGMATQLRPDVASLLTAATDRRGLEEADPRGVDLVGLLEPATTAALRDAVASVGQAGGAEAAATGDGGVAQALGPQLSVDVQIAYDAERVVLLGRAGESVYSRFAPSHDGLLATRGDATSLVWPGTAVASNLSPNRQVVRLLHGLDLPPTDAERLGVADGVPLYRFAVLHLVRPRVDQPVLRLTRGGQLLPVRFVDRATLSNMADRVGQHLFGRFIGQGRVRGGYRPSRGIYQPELADDVEAALASYALVRLVERHRRDGEVDGIFDAYVTVAADVVQTVTQRLGESASGVDPTADQPPPADPGGVGAATFSLLTMLHAPAGTFTPELRQTVAEHLLQRVDESGRVRAASDDAASALPPATEAACLAALGELYRQTRDPQTGSAVMRLQESLWERTQGRFDVKALPWAAAAQVDTGPLLVDDGLLELPVQQERTARLASLLPVLGELQVVGRPRVGPADVMGGIVVQPGPEGSPPNPTWTTAPLFQFMAIVLRDQEAVGPGPRRGALLTLGGAARFLGQLMVDEPQAFAMSSPPEATGGIRLSLWDNRLDIAPSAVTLLGLMEWRDTVERLALPDEPDAGAAGTAADDPSLDTDEAGR